LAERSFKSPIRQRNSSSEYQDGRPSTLGFGLSRTPSPDSLYLAATTSPTMAKNPPKKNGRDRTLAALDAFIKILDVAKDGCGIPPAQAVFASVSALLTIIRVRLPHIQRTRGSNSRRPRTRRLISKTTLSLRSPAHVCVKPLTEV
jgi:hypothetical protein